MTLERMASWDHMLRVAAALSCLLLSLPVSAELRPKSWALNWVRGPGAEACPGPAAIARAVETRLSRVAFVAVTVAEVSVEGYVQGSPQGGLRTRLTLVERDGQRIGERELSSAADDCVEMTEAVVLAITLMIDPEAESGMPPLERTPPASAVQDEPPAPLGTTPPSPNQTREAAKPVATAPDDETSRPWRGTLGIGLPIAFGLLPEMAPGIAIRGAVFLPDSVFGAELDARYFFSQVSEIRPGTGGAFTMFLVGLSGCAASRQGLVRPSACLGLSGGSIAATAYGLDRIEPTEGFVLNAAGRGRLALAALAHFRVVAGAELVVPLWRDRFAVYEGDEPTDLFRLPPVAGLVEFGVAFEF